MDEKPFFEFSIGKITEATITELKRFQKGTFDVNDILDKASDLKYSKEIKEFLSSELLNSPSDDFVKFIAKKVYGAKVIEQFKILTYKSSTQLIKEIINEKLNRVIDNETQQEEEEEEEEEEQSVRIIQAILIRVLEVGRIHYRDTKSYFGILLDNNNRNCIYIKIELLLHLLNILNCWSNKLEINSTLVFM